MRKSIGLVALLIAGAALAQGAMPSFEEVDTNSDGQISREEAQTIEGLDFATADTNQDGSLSRAEYQAAAQSEDR